MLDLIELQTLIVTGRTLYLAGVTEDEETSEMGSRLECINLFGLVYSVELFPGLLAASTKNSLVVVERVIEDEVALWVCENTDVLRVADPKGEIIAFRDEAWRALVDELHLGQTETLEYTSSGFRFVSEPDLERTIDVWCFASLDQIFRGDEQVLVSYPEGGLVR